MLPHLGVRSDNFKLIYFYTVNEWELYDLKKDPQEIQNLYRDQNYQKIVLAMKKELDDARNRYDDHQTAGVLR